MFFFLSICLSFGFIHLVNWWDIVFDDGNPCAYLMGTVIMMVIAFGTAILVLNLNMLGRMQQAKPISWWVSTFPLIGYRQLHPHDGTTSAPTHFQRVRAPKKTKIHVKRYAKTKATQNVLKQFPSSGQKSAPSTLFFFIVRKFTLIYIIHRRNSISAMDLCSPAIRQ